MTPEVALQNYLAAIGKFEEDRANLAALPADERAASGITPDNRPVFAAAKAFAAVAAERHKIEERAVVYLVLGPNGWEIDSTTTYGGPLEGYENGPLNEACDHEAGLDNECQALAEAAAWVSIPDGKQLTHLLNEDLLVES